ncbi:MAG: peptide deformylase [Eubacteriales bacterium]|nr:peptide deformylase [Eubacteriales bacterium]
MALRNIVIEGDDILRKVCRPVAHFDDKLQVLLDDMKETMYAYNGVGLAAPQIGVLRRIFVMDVQDGRGLIEFVNPEIIETRGSQTSCEGCLSIPDFQGNVIRPAFVRVRAYDRYGKIFEYESGDLGAVCVSHENDHLNGILFRDKVTE